MAKQKFVKKFIKKAKTNYNEPDLDMSLVRILNWYTASDFTEKQRKMWVIEFAKANGYDSKKVRKVNEKYFMPTFSTVCRLKTRGYEDESQDSFIDEHFEKLLSRVQEKEVVVATDKKKPTIQDRILDQAKVVMAEVDYFVDQKIQFNVDNKVVTLLSDNNFGRPQTQHVINLIQVYINDFTSVKDGKLKDSELFDAYGLSVRKLNAMIKYLEQIKTECEDWISAKKKLKTVTARKKKVKSPIEIAKNAKVAEVTILTPHKIIGESFVVIHQPKFNFITLLVAEDNDGLTIKGTTITNFNPKKSKVYRATKKFKENVPKQFKGKKGINLIKRILADDSKFKISKYEAKGRLSDQSNIMVTG